MPSPQLVEIDYEAQIHETPKGGKLFLIGGEEVWLPASAIEVDVDRKIITMPKKLAYEKGLI